MKRSAILSLKFATAVKLQAVADLLVEYRKAVNFYIGLCWGTEGGFDAETLRKLGGPLSYRYKGQALKQAMAIVVATKRSAKTLAKLAEMPIFRGGADLSTNFLNLLFNANSFDCWTKLSILVKGKPVWLPIRKTRVLNHWLAQGKLIAGGTLFDRKGKLYIRVSVDVPTPAVKSGGQSLGIDRGVNVVLATSEGQLIGTDLDRYIDRIKRTVPGSNGRARAMKARTQYVNECLKTLPFAAFTIFVIEQLKGIKFGKRGKLSRRMNRRFSHWTVGSMGERLQQLCQENCVLLAEVPPAYTSQCCPACSHVEKGNRRGTVFRCRACGYIQHADLVGARNIRDVYRGKILVPSAKVQNVKV